jgi:anaphase-promoting complex subunit 3
MGRLLKRVGSVDAALSSFCAALDLRPPAQEAALVQAAIDKVHLPDDSEEEEL